MVFPEKEKGKFLELMYLNYISFPLFFCLRNNEE
jgi:hypothetical protein